MGEERWKIIEEFTIEGFYDEVDVYETIGYVLIPESFNVISSSTVSGSYKYYCLMKKE